MGRDNRHEAYEYLIDLANKQGYVTFNEIVDCADDHDLPINPLHRGYPCIWSADDVQLYADRSGQADPCLQALFRGVRDKQTRFFPGEIPGENERQTFKTTSRNRRKNP